MEPTGCLYQHKYEIRGFSSTEISAKNSRTKADQRYQIFFFKQAKVKLASKYFE